ncbi:hydroxyacylglutathione hydrolase [Methylococcus sp. EFPC2]|uniref:hydroxyacylglutathione hydrolase n=1 Tax=Methylococcus sp. EFPC2 TaxID=2812648 RepID=UPI0019686668|nr:hydroxyacylglutathione hydrolase [Methylococcus sp. EFPC2]QSA96579.1 hydroxyacylglutathione hydrolase [Methylococcus sp. EFPC2]
MNDRTETSPAEIVQIPVLQDNYVYLIHDPASGATAAVDPAEAEPVLLALERRGWRLSHVLNTHHHGDHVGGNLELQARTGCTIVGYAGDRARIPGIGVAVKEGDRIPIGEQSAVVLEVPGHTRGHIAYWFTAANALFCGDTLFALGCGRLFEGTAEQMWTSLGKIRDLPPATLIYCAHEYTQANGRFALTVEADNVALIERMKRVDEARTRNEATVPSMLSEELETNPFLRAGDSARFAQLRRQKDQFKA